MRKLARPLATLALLALACAAAGGCTLVHQVAGRPVPDARAALTVGTSTKAEALAALGPPISVRRQFDGDLLTWRRDEQRSENLLLVPLLPIYDRFEGQSDADVLTLLFDRRGVLTGIGEQRDLH